MSIARTAATGGDLDPDFLRWQTSLPVDQRLLDVDASDIFVDHVNGRLKAHEVLDLKTKIIAKSAVREVLAVVLPLRRYENIPSTCGPHET